MTKYWPQLQAQHLRWSLLLATLLLIVGLFSPLLTLTKFMLINNSLSIIAGVGQLWQEGKYILFIIISLFSIILPIAKVILLFNLLHPQTISPNKRKKLLHLMHDYGRWAMLDVMVVAILIVTVKLGAIAGIQIHTGLYIFALAVLLIMLITQQVVSLMQK